MAKNIINEKETLKSSVQVQEVAAILKKELVPRIKKKRIYLCFGDDDFFFSQKGFERLGNIFKRAGNDVTMMKIKKSGHMVLFDNKGPKIKALILKLLKKQK